MFGTPLAVILGLTLFSFVVYYQFPGLLFRTSLYLGRLKGGLVSKSIDVGEDSISYLVGGVGEPLLLLHGFGADKDNWILAAPYLKNEFKLIIPDLPGFGESPYREGRSYSVNDYLDILVAFIEKLGVKKLHIGGNSMGGYIATALASRLKLSTISVWLLAPAGVTTEEKAEGIALIESGDNPLIIESESDFDRLIRMCFEAPPPTPKPVKHFLFEKAKARAETNRLLFSDLVGDDVNPGENPFKLEDLIGQLDAKVLLVWGDKDRILHSEGLDVLAKKLEEKGSQYKGIMMRDMGHIPMIERPKETVQDYLNFRREVS